MKKLITCVVAAAVMSSLATTTVCAKTLSASELKHYQPLKKYDYRMIDYDPYKGPVTYRLFYDGDAWYNSKNLADTTSYDLQQNNYYITVYGEYVGLKIKTPAKVGQLTTHTDLDGTMKFKVVSTSKTLKIKKTTYKNVLVVKNVTYGTTMYIAKNRGLVLIKNSKNGKKISEMVGVIN